MPNSPSDFDIGDLVNLDMTFKTTELAVIDPTSVIFTLRLPNATLVIYTYGVDGQITRSTTGKYNVLYSPLTEGTYYYRFAGTGACQTAEEKSFYTRPKRA